MKKTFIYFPEVFDNNVNYEKVKKVFIRCRKSDLNNIEEYFSIDEDNYLNESNLEPIQEITLEAKGDIKFDLSNQGTTDIERFQVSEQFLIIHIRTSIEIEEDYKIFPSVWYIFERLTGEFIGIFKRLDQWCNDIGTDTLNDGDISSRGICYKPLLLNGSNG